MLGINQKTIVIIEVFSCDFTDIIKKGTVPNVVMSEAINQPTIQLLGQFKINFPKL